jgi:mannan endo-1,4-beta-mannosidase
MMLDPERQIIVRRMTILNRNRGPIVIACAVLSLGAVAAIARSSELYNASDFLPRQNNFHQTAIATFIGRGLRMNVASVNPDVPNRRPIARPTYNTGNGFFVLNGKLYDAKGYEFRVRGVNRVHWDSNSAAGIAKSGANAVRWDIDFSRETRDNVKLIQAQSIEKSNVPILGNWAGTCKSDPAILMSIVSTWVAQAPLWTKLDKYLIVNVANEWGGSNSTVWRDAYIGAIRSLRAAGYLGTILVDTGGCGQDIDDLLQYSPAVFNSDPQRNVMFALHIYGRIPTASVGPYLAQLAALRDAEGIPFLVGEFGPGRNIGPSATLTTPADVITAAEANGIGWLAWAWDDNNLPNARADDTWFSMTYAGVGVYTTASDLTIFGRDVVLDANYGIKALATPASIF